MTVVAFSMAGFPRGKQRHRNAIRKGRDGRSFVSQYTPAETVAYEKSVADLGRKAMGNLAPFVGPLSVSLQFRLDVPKSYSKSLRAAILAGEEWYFGAYDLDNLTKAIYDGLNSVAYIDDRQIVRSFQTKLGHVRPGVDVRVEALAEPEHG
jgi:Holliday junction resolvase RusA-like endonuclease